MLEASSNCKTLPTCSDQISDNYSCKNFWKCFCPAIHATCLHFYILSFDTELIFVDENDKSITDDI